MRKPSTQKLELWWPRLINSSWENAISEMIAKCYHKLCTPDHTTHKLCLEDWDHYLPFQLFNLYLES